MTERNGGAGSVSPRPAGFFVDWRECLVKGAIGAAGAVPGTILAHPADVVKMRMQTNSSSLYPPRVVDAVRSVTHGSTIRWYGGPPPTASQQLVAGLRSGSLLFRGLFPAIQQKVMTRGLMFLAAEVAFESLRSTTSLSLTQACFVGAAMSGYTTGSIAALWEFGKVLQSQTHWRPNASVGRTPAHSSTSRGRATSRAILTAVAQAGTSRSLLRRLHAAGIRNAIFDSCFFGTQHVLSENTGLSTGVTYASAAGVAVIVDYSVDVCVKRMMVLPPESNVPSILSMWKRTVVTSGTNLLQRIRRLHAGASVKAVEFAISYFATGTVGIFCADQLRSFLHPPRLN